MAVTGPLKLISSYADMVTQNWATLQIATLATCSSSLVIRLSWSVTRSLSDFTSLSSSSNFTSFFYKRKENISNSISTVVCFKQLQWSSSLRELSINLTRPIYSSLNLLIHAPKMWAETTVNSLGRALLSLVMILLNTYSRELRRGRFLKSWHLFHLLGWLAL